MILGVGTDLVEIGRIERAVERHGERFLKRIFTEGERAYCRGFKLAFQHLAARWAAKEAASKALGTGIFGSVRFRDIEVGNEKSGKPFLMLHGDAARLSAELGATRWHVSLSHTDSHATAVAIAEGETPK